MKKRAKGEWLKAIIWLKKTFPATEPITVRSKLRCKIEYKALGTAYFCPESRRFEVTIASDQIFENCVLVLFHEWAHVVTWHKIYARCIIRRKKESFHNKEWGIAYAQIYRSFFETKPIRKL
ncbi:hypothetical protein LCGC14_2242520 [marine sediment metagenome]|uniref:SprT-like domain-containing protein n=1 Tax=marine sediment metagenome TaxID=412755 RepID=A0A0F9D549_9ZZZZ